MARGALPEPVGAWAGRDRGRGPGGSGRAASGAGGELAHPAQASQGLSELMSSGEGHLPRPPPTAQPLAVRCGPRLRSAFAANFCTGPPTLTPCLSRLPRPAGRRRRMSTDAILSKARMIQTEINVYNQEISQLKYKVKDQQDKIKDNKEKIKLNKQLPYLVANVVEVRCRPPPVSSSAPPGFQSGPATTHHTPHTLPAPR